MKRRVILILLFGIAGAIVNVAVAWGSSIWSSARYDEQPLKVGDSFTLSDDNRTHGIKVRLRPGSWIWSEASVIGAKWRQMGLTMDNEPSECMHQHFAGLPMRSFYCTGSVNLPPRFVNGDVVSAVEWTGGLDCPSILNPQLTPYFVLPSIERPLPYRLLIGGFAINTLFYAAILWMLFAAPFALRRCRRIKRGQCPKCAYDLRHRASDSSACPECGAPSHQTMLATR